MKFNFKHKLFWKICETCKQPEGCYLKWYLLILRWSMFPIDMSLIKIRNSGIFIRKMEKDTAIIFDVEIPMNKIYLFAKTYKPDSEVIK